MSTLAARSACRPDGRRRGLARPAGVSAGRTRPVSAAPRPEATLTAAGDQTILVLEERGMPLNLLAEYGAGIQVHVEDLAAHVAVRDRCDAESRWDRAAARLPGPRGRSRLGGERRPRPRLGCRGKDRQVGNLSWRVGVVGSNLMETDALCVAVYNSTGE
jgi:hypothetical protein